MTTYRPTVRCDVRFKDYISEVSEATGIDRVQVIRLALFSAPYSAVFRQEIARQVKSGKVIPEPVWGMEDGSMWLNPQGDDQLRGPTPIPDHIKREMDGLVVDGTIVAGHVEIAAATESIPTMGELVIDGVVIRIGVSKVIAL